MATRKSVSVSSHRTTHIAKQLESRCDDETAVDRALRSANLSRRDLNREGHFIDCYKEAQFLQAAVEIVDDPSFAAKIGLGFVQNSAITIYIARYSVDLRDAVENARKYSVLVDVNSTYALHASSNAVSLTIKCSDPYLRHDQRHREFLVFTIIAAMRYVTSRDFNPLEIRFEHRSPKAGDAIQRLVECPVVFGAEETEIILAPSTLNFAIPTYDPSLLRYLKDYGDGLLSKINQPAPDLSAQVENLLINNLPGRLLAASEVASNLGMGRRTLARRLAETGISYSTIVDRMRCNLASKYLSQSETPISEIAFLLDFSEQASFSAAFKRWTGETPKMYRTNNATV